MRLIRSCVLSLSMFTKLPMPKVKWEPENMRYVLCFLPLAGALMGGALFGWERLCTWLRLGSLIRAAGFTLLPVLLSGGIHLDGFLDVSDALGSHAEPEKKREILKDSHVGAFAVVACCCWFLAMFAFCTEVEVANGAVWRMALIPVLSRTMGALCALLYPAYGETGLLSSFRENAPKVGGAVALGLVFLAAAGAMVYLDRIPGAVTVLAGLAVAAVLYPIAKKQLQGMSGDLAGWYITVSELIMLMALVISEKAVLL